jgi:hypothetical protein
MPPASNAAMSRIPTKNPTRCVLMKELLSEFGRPRHRTGSSIFVIALAAALPLLFVLAIEIPIKELLTGLLKTLT